MKKKVPSSIQVPQQRAPEFLRKSLQHMEDRATEYDAPEGERSMAKTVAMFNIYADQALTEEEGWMFMAILKMVRSHQGEYKADNYEDLSAYGSLAGETASKWRTDLGE